MAREITRVNVDTPVSAPEDHSDRPLVFDNAQLLTMEDFNNQVEIRHLHRDIQITMTPRLFTEKCVDRPATFDNDTHLRIGERGENRYNVGNFHRPASAVLLVLPAVH